MHHRRQTEDDAAEQRNHDGEREHSQIQLRPDERRERHGARCDQRRQRDLRDRHARQRAEQRQHAAFGDELPQQASLAGAQCRAHRDFVLPGVGPADQQIRDVRAGNQQHQGDGGHERQDDGRAAEHIICQRTDLDTTLLVGLRIGRIQLARNHVEFRARRVERRAGLEARERLKPAVTAVVERRAAQGERHPELRRVGHAGKARRHDADDGERSRAELNRSTHDRGIGAEAAAPESVAEDNHGVAIGHRVFFRPNTRPCVGDTPRNRSTARETTSTGTGSGSSSPGASCSARYTPPCPRNWSTRAPVDVIGIGIPRRSRPAARWTLPISTTRRSACG